MNNVTMRLKADRLIRQALEEDISSEDVSTNAVIRYARRGSVDLIVKQDGVIAGLPVYEGYLKFWIRVWMSDFMWRKVIRLKTAESSPQSAGI